MNSHENDSRVFGEKRNRVANAVSQDECDLFLVSATTSQMRGGAELGSRNSPKERESEAGSRNGGHGETE